MDTSTLGGAMSSVPRTRLLGGKQTLLTTADSGGDSCRMSDGLQKMGEFRGRDGGGGPGGEGTMVFLFLEAERRLTV